MPTQAKQAALCDGSASTARAWGLTQKLQFRLSSATEFIRDGEQPEIVFEPARANKIFQPRKCQQFGICVCGAADQLGRLCLAVHDRVTALLKRLCWSRTKPVQQKSPARVFLEDGPLVLRFGRFQPGEPQDVQGTSALWYHVGYVNYKTWALTFHKLLLHDDAQMVRLHSASFSDLATDCFQSSCEAFHKDMDFDCPYTLSLHVITESSERVAEQDMKLGIVAVFPLRSDGVDDQEMCVWRGQEAERPARRRGNGQGRGRGRGRPGAVVDAEAALDDVLADMEASWYLVT